jgi:nitroreductase
MMNTSIDFLNVREAAEQRRSIRTYEPVPVPREDMEDILDVARRAPSAFNVQPWRFVVVETPELKERLAAAAFNQRQVHSAPAVIVLYTDMKESLENLDAVVHPGMTPEQQEATQRTIRSHFARQSEDERETWAQGQGYIALGYLLLAAEARGYQTSPMSGFDPAAVKKLLHLPENARIPALIAIGRGAEEGFPQHRLPLERIVRVA